MFRINSSSYNPLVDELRLHEQTRFFASKALRDHHGSPISTICDYSRLAVHRWENLTSTPSSMKIRWNHLHRTSWIWPVTIDRPRLPVDLDTTEQSSFSIHAFQKHN
ncbi:hypothetical protein KC19_11G061600 [Ceratodon purpureus]|uniref:Uncharacterized protein n=1 Tax=Ceratodon purpureus TaxID=3225 RepID=A0A8T0GDF2_CERPU|nr:hypothetical protein KC19_11G061600 [Ceratodon purpureus]